MLGIPIEVLKAWETQCHFYSDAHYDLKNVEIMTFFLSKNCIFCWCKNNFLPFLKYIKRCFLFLCQKCVFNLQKTFYKFILTVMKLAQIQCSGTRIGIRWISGWFRGLVLLYIRSGFRISRSTSGFEKLLLQMLLLKRLKKLAIEVILFDRLLLVVFSFIASQKR